MAYFVIREKIKAEAVSQDPWNKLKKNIKREVQHRKKVTDAMSKFLEDSGYVIIKNPPEYGVEEDTDPGEE